MGSSRGQDRSLGNTGLSLPQWMKGRGDTRYDFDQSSFSPPSHDDSFLCIRYSSKPTSDNTSSSSSSLASSRSGQEGYRPISQVLSENTSLTVGQASSSSGNQDLTIIKDTKNIDFSRHPLPCQPFIPAAGGKEIKTATSVSSNRSKVSKSQGTDDGFHSEPALCGKSIVNVATRMMSRKLAKIETASEANGTFKSGSAIERNEEQFVRRGSKSLPVTPLASPSSTPDASPKLHRRGNANRYFSGTFLPDRDKYQSGWLLSSILGQSRESSMGTSHRIPEVDEDEPIDAHLAKFLNRKKSISSQNLSYVGKNDETQEKQQQQRDDESKKETAVYTNVFRAKPSELREMNFWSPTSM